MRVRTPRHCQNPLVADPVIVSILVHNWLYRCLCWEWMYCLAWVVVKTGMKQQWELQFFIWSWLGLFSICHKNVDLKIVPAVFLLTWDDFMCWWKWRAANTSFLLSSSPQPLLKRRNGSIIERHKCWGGHEPDATSNFRMPQSTPEKMPRTRESRRAKCKCFDLWVLFYWHVHKGV